MSRTTIDFGIDLGTTNSAIAILRGTTTEIIKNNLDNDIMASAVFIDKRGSIKTGSQAKNQLQKENASEDVYLEFKRRMGTAYQYQFKSAQRVMLPEDLSAEILKSLGGDVQQRLGEDIEAAVITVPAAFEQKQCAATKKAGEMAGLLQCPLLQEPVAAALAYGFQADVTKEYWLIYDFGGGTFDVAVMKADDGTISVVNHGGDNYLGGSDIDWAIVERLVIPELTSEFNLPNFSRGNEKWLPALRRLKAAAETAKVDLSRVETTYIETEIRDAEGDEVEVYQKLTRDNLINVAEPIIMRSVEICKRVLKEKNLVPAAIEKVILVGGPTLAPYFRKMLQANLGIQLDHSVDPLTVVARGAAVFAGTQRLARKTGLKVPRGHFEIDLRYKPVGTEADPTIHGVVKSQSDLSLEGFTIEFVNQKTLWRNGKFPVKKSGQFRLNLLAEKGHQNIFTIELLDSNGIRQVTVPDSLTYTMGMAISEQPITNSIAMALANNDVHVLLKKGEPLPAKATWVYHSAHAVRKGSDDHILTLPVVEGEIELADRNLLLGKMVIRGTDIRRDVPAGSEIEVTLHMDTSRIIWVNAYIPMLDEEFKVKIDYNNSNHDPKRLQQEYEAELARIKVLRKKGENAEDAKAAKLLDEVGNLDDFLVIESLLNAAKADPDAANNAAKKLLEIKAKVDRVENSLKWPVLVADANQALDKLEALIEEHGTADHQERAKELREQVEELIEQKRTDALMRKMNQITDLRHEFLFEQPGFWLGFFEYLVDEREKMIEQATAERLFNQGRQFIDNGNVGGLRAVVSQLLGLLPQDVAEQIQRGYESGLLK